MRKQINTSDTLIRKSEVIKLTGLSNTTIWRLDKKGDFPKPIKIGGNSVRYSFDEISNWIEVKKSIRE